MTKRKMNRKLMGIVAVVLIAVAVFSILQATGLIKFLSVGTLSVATTQGTVGVSLMTSVRSYAQPLSTVTAGQSYQWEMTARNTGTLSWSNSWATVRLGINGATVTSKTEPGVSGSFRVETCSYGTDTSSCREDLRAGAWGLQYHSGTCAGGGSWLNPTISGDVASIIYGALSSGQSKTMCFKLSVPSTASGNYPLITNLMVYSGGTYAVASQTDSLGVGTVSGDLTMTFVGIVSALASIILLAAIFLPK